MSGNNHGSRLIRNSLFNLFNNLVMMAMTWVISIWVARQLGPENYGIFSMALWVTGVFSWVIGLGLIHAVTKFVSEQTGAGNHVEAGRVVAFVMRIEILLSVIVTVVLCFFASPIADFFFSPKESFFFFLAFLGLLPGAVTAVLSATIEGIQKFGYFTVASLLISPLSFAAKIIALLMHTGITGQLVVMLVFSFVNVLFYWIVLNKVGMKFSLISPSPEKSLLKRIARYNSSVMTITLVDKVVWDKSENFFLGRLCNACEIAYYNLGFNVAQRFTSILPATFWRVLFPAMSGYFGSSDETKMRRLFFLSTRYIAFAAIPLAIAGAMLSWDIVSLLYGHPYAGAKPVLQIMFLISIATSLAQPGAAILYGYERQSFIYKLGFIMALVNITLDICLIPRFGAFGAVICYSITTVIGTSIGTTWTCRMMKLPFPFVSVTKIAFASVVMGLVMEFVRLKTSGIFGLVITGLIGTITYLVCSLAIASIEDEDFMLLERVRDTMPTMLRPAIGSLIEVISQVKPRR